MKGSFFILFFKSILPICLLIGEFSAFKVIIDREGLTIAILLFQHVTLLLSVVSSQQAYTSL